MKNFYRFYLFLLLPSILSAQCGTIYCNEFQNVVVLSPSPISQAVTGSEHFVFSYNKTSPDSLGLLQGSPGHRSNLVIRTTDGAVYTYTLEYREVLSDYTYEIKKADRVRLVASAPVKPELNPEKKKADKAVKENYYNRLTAYFATKAKKPLAVKRSGKIRFEVLGLQHHRNEVYVTYRIKNNSRINFEMGGLSLYKIQGKKSRRSSFQKIRLKAVYQKQIPKIISIGEVKQFTVVYPKFSLGDHQKLKCELIEGRGSRFLELFLI